MGFADPPLCLEAWQRSFRVSALNRRGMCFLPSILVALKAADTVAQVRWAIGNQPFTNSVHDHIK